MSAVGDRAGRASRLASRARARWGRLVSSLLFGVTPADPATLLGVALFRSAVAISDDRGFRLHPVASGFSRKSGNHARRAFDSSAS
jgi:hypothetical protein